MSLPVRWSSDALSDLADQIAYIASDNPAASRCVGAVLDQAALALSEMPTGRPGRATGTYEKLVAGLPYILAYVIAGTGEQEEVAIVRMIHTSCNWPAKGGRPDLGHFRTCKGCLIYEVQYELPWRLLPRTALGLSIQPIFQGFKYA